MSLQIQKKLFNSLFLLNFLFSAGCTYVSNLPFITGESFPNKPYSEKNIHINDHPHPHNYSHSEPLPNSNTQIKKIKNISPSNRNLSNYRAVPDTQNSTIFSLNLTSTESKKPQVNKQSLSKYNYTIQTNDTLYSIARLSKTSVTNLQTINNIVDATQIVVGQTIQVTQPIKKPKSIDKKTKSKPLSTTSKIKKSKNKPLSTTSKIKNKASKKSKKTKKSPSWVWPTKGKISKKYNPKRIGGKGIRISAPKNTPVRASKKGVVVYSGDSIKGYGNVIIVQHENQLISIYGFLNKSLVKKGNRVAKRQKIGTVGISPNKKSLLHFEIHKNRKHKNPLEYIGKTRHF